MDELEQITNKYTPDYIKQGLSSLENLKTFSLMFYKDVAEIYDCLTRLKHIDRNPTGFSLEDAPILGLLVRVAKLLKEVLIYYERDNAEIIAILDRPIIEASTISIYLMEKGPEVVLDYRKCSYKDRLRLLRELENGSKFFNTKPGQRLLRSIRDKMETEGFSKDDFSEQKKNKWRLQGKNFFQIFAEIQHEDLYHSTYGMMSESIHGSWNEALDWCLHKQPDGTYTANLYSYPADVRFVAPMLHFTNPAFREWLKRIDCYDENTQGILNWIDKVNGVIFRKFDELFDE